MSEVKDRVSDNVVMPTAKHLESTNEEVLRAQPKVPDITAGALLREARERIGLSQEAVADHLKLRLSQIKAIESNAFASMQVPAVYWRGHLRLYARLVQLDADYVVRCFDGHHHVKGNVKLTDPKSAIACDRYHEGRKRLLSKRWLLIDAAVVAVIVGLAAWYMFSGDAKPVMPVTPPPGIDNAEAPGPNHMATDGNQVFQLTPTKNIQPSKEGS